MPLSFLGKVGTSPSRCTPGHRTPSIIYDMFSWRPVTTSLKPFCPNALRASLSRTLFVPSAPTPFVQTLRANPSCKPFCPDTDFVKILLPRHRLRSRPSTTTPFSQVLLPRRPSVQPFCPDALQSSPSAPTPFSPALLPRRPSVMPFCPDLLQSGPPALMPFCPDALPSSPSAPTSFSQALLP
jgi:hypothetical protein